MDGRLGFGSRDGTMSQIEKASPWVEDVRDGLRSRLQGRDCEVAKAPRRGAFAARFASALYWRP